MESLQEVLCQSLTLFHQREFAAAEERLRNGLERFADAGCLWQLLGLVQNDSGAWQEARSSLETASCYVPLKADASYTLAICYLREERRDLAILLLRGVAVNPATPMWLLPLTAALLGNLRQNALALAACRQIVRRDARRHDAHFGVGFYSRRMHLPGNRAMNAFHRAYELAPEVPLYRVVLAGLHHEQGELEEACDLLKGLPPENIGCRAQIRRMMNVFRAARDIPGMQRCGQVLRRLSAQCDCKDEE